QAVERAQRAARQGFADRAGTRARRGAAEHARAAVQSSPCARTLQGRQRARGSAGDRDRCDPRQGAQRYRCAGASKRDRGSGSQASAGIRPAAGPAGAVGQQPRARQRDQSDGAHEGHDGVEPVARNAPRPAPRASRQRHVGAAADRLVEPSERRWSNRQVRRRSKSQAVRAGRAAFGRGDRGKPAEDTSNVPDQTGRLKNSLATDRAQMNTDKQKHVFPFSHLCPSVPHLWLILFSLIVPSVFAAPTQQEVFRSIQDNVGSTTDPKKFFAFLAGTVGLVLLLAVASKRKQRQVTPKTLNHQGKLLREIVRQVDLRPAEIRQLKMLAEAQNVSSPITLLLCPS